MAFDPTCPHCHSEQTQLVRLLLQASTQTGSANTTGISYSHGGGLGVSGSTTQIAMQTQLAAKYRMSPYPSRNHGLLVIGIILGVIGLMLIKSVLGLFFLGAGAIPILLWVSQGSGLENRQRQWNEQKLRMDRLWLCHRCGHEWVPEQE